MSFTLRLVFAATFLSIMLDGSAAHAQYCAGLNTAGGITAVAPRSPDRSPTLRPARVMLSSLTPQLPVSKPATTAPWRLTSSPPAASAKRADRGEEPL